MYGILLVTGVLDMTKKFGALYIFDKFFYMQQIHWFSCNRRNKLSKLRTLFLSFKKIKKIVHNHLMSMSTKKIIKNHEFINSIVLLPTFVIRHINTRTINQHRFIILVLLCICMNREQHNNLLSTLCIDTEFVKLCHRISEST